MLSINFTPFPVLSTERLLLKSMRLADTESIFYLRSDPQVMKFINRPLITTFKEAEDWIRLVQSNLENNQGITWGIFLRERPEANIGNIGLWRIEKENYRAEIGYMIEPAHQGKGIMSEAIQSVIEYGFSEMKLHSIEAQLNPENYASSRLLEKAGFVKEARFKENIFWNGKYEDTLVYSLINPD